jgi:hypothetical protein
MLRPLADDLAAARRRQAQRATSERYAHVLGCIRETEREMHRVDHTLRAAVDAVRDGDLEAARRWLDEVEALADSLRNEVHTAALALVVTRDRDRT